MKARKAFTFIELTFVILIIGILSKFGVEFLAQSYRNFISTKINNELQANSATAVEFIATRLQHRIKDSVIARVDANNSFQALASSTFDDNADILEWVGSDIDGYRGDDEPYWSGVIDIDDSNASATVLISPQTNTTKIDTLINDLSYGTSDMNSTAIYFIGSNTDITGYGWNGAALTDQNTSVIHSVDNIVGQTNRYKPVRGDNGNTNTFADVDVYEYYKLTWTAYAVVHEDGDGDGDADDLVLYYNYQPWKGESYDDNTTDSALIMQNVSTFRFRSIGSTIKIQVCVTSDLLTNEEYSICKEKTVF